MKKPTAQKPVEEKPKVIVPALPAHDLEYYIKCYISGSLAGSITQTVFGNKKTMIPNFLGFLLHGSTKFTTAEVLKDYLPSRIKGCTCCDDSTKKLILKFLPSVIGEFFGDILLAPLDAIRKGAIKDNTSCCVSAKKTCGNGICSFYKTLPSLWLRQIPYTMLKTMAFEPAHNLIYKHILNEKPRDKYSYTTQ